jgi:antitoxin ParD1/3/4
LLFIAGVTKFWYRMQMAGKNTSIALGEQLEGYARRKVATGEFGSISEVIRDALRHAAERDARVEALRAALIDGENSGLAGPWDLQEFLKERRLSHREAA